MATWGSGLGETSDASQTAAQLGAAVEIGLSESRIDRASVSDGRREPAEVGIG